MQGLCHLFLFIGILLPCLQVCRKKIPPHKDKHNIYFLKTLAICLLQRMSDSLLNKFIDCL